MRLPIVDKGKARFLEASLFALTFHFFLQGLDRI